MTRKKSGGACLAHLVERRLTISGLEVRAPHWERLLKKKVYTELPFPQKVNNEGVSGFKGARIKDFLLYTLSLTLQRSWLEI